MTDYLVALATLLILGAGLMHEADPPPQPLLIEAGGEWCDVRPPRPEPPRGKYEYRIGDPNRDRGIA